MDTFSTTTIGSPTDKEEARKCNLADKNKDKNETTKEDKKNEDATMMDVADSIKPNDGPATASTVTKSNMTRVVTHVSISESEDDCTGAAKDIDLISDDKKREKEYKPHNTLAPKKKAKIESLTGHEENKDSAASTDLTTLAKKPEAPQSVTPLDEDKSLVDVIDLKKLHELMEQNKDAATKLAGKDLLLPIGYTGSGKIIVDTVGEYVGKIDAGAGIIVTPETNIETANLVISHAITTTQSNTINDSPILVF